MQGIIGGAAVLLNIIGYIPYIRDIFRGKVKPHKVTWCIWAILTIVTAVNQVLNGGGYSSLFLISTAILVCFVCILSFRYGVGGASTLDRICLIAAILLFLYWITIKDTYISTLLAVLIDILGAIPTIIKTYNHPKTESYPQWVFAAMGGLLTLFSVPEMSFILIIYPLYIFLMDGTIVAIKYFREL